MESDWQEFGKKNVKTISFVILRSQDPIFLTAGKFHTVTLSTLLSVSVSIGVINLDLSTLIDSYI